MDEQGNIIIYQSKAVYIGILLFLYILIGIVPVQSFLFNLQFLGPKIPHQNRIIALYGELHGQQGGRHGKSQVRHLLEIVFDGDECHLRMMRSAKLVCDD